MADIQNSTAVTPDPVEQSTTSAPTTNPPATAPTQQASDVYTAAGQPSLTPNGAGQTEGTATTTNGTTAQLEPQSQPAASDNNPQSQAQPQTTQPTPAKPIVAPPAPGTATEDAHPWTRRLLATAQRLTGGPQYTTTIGTDGVAKRVEVPANGRGLGWALALEALAGGLAGAGAHGPDAVGQAAGAGLEKGEQIGQQRAQVQEQADQKAQQDYVRQFEATKANLQMFDTMQAVGKHSYDIANGPVEAYKDFLKQWSADGQVANPDVDEKEAIAIENLPMHEYFRVPTVTQPSIDPNTGQQIWTNHNGNPVPPNTPGATPQWDHRFAMVHRNADVSLKNDEGNLQPAIQGLVDQGRLDPAFANAAQSAKVPAGGVITDVAKQQASNAMREYLYGPHGVLAQANEYRDRRDAAAGTAPNVYDPAKDSIYDLFGGNVSHLSDFVQSHASPQAIKDNNFAMIPAGPDWTGDVDRTGHIPLRIYPDKKSGQDATDVYLTSRQEANPKETVQDFVNSVTSLPGGGAVSSVQPFVQAQAKDTGIDANILNAVIAKESRFNPAANGSSTDPKSTAKGLMQVNDPTAKAYGLDPDQMHDKAYGIQAGATVLADKIKKAGDDVRKGLMNYYGSGDKKQDAAYADDIIQRAASYQKDPTLLQQYEGNQGNQNTAGYIKSIFSENSATNINDAPDHAKPVADWNATISEDPALADQSFRIFNKMLYNNPKNPKASPGIALSLMKGSPRQANFMVRLMGGSPDTAADYDTNRSQVNVGLTEGIKNQAKLAYEEGKRANEQKDIIKRNQPLIDNIVNGGTLDPTSIATMRASDRETIFGEILKRTGGRFSLQALRNMNNLSAEIADKFTTGTFGYKVGNVNTAYGHAGAAFDDLQQLKSLLPNGDISPYINKPINSVLQNLRTVNPQAADALARYSLNLHNATIDWQNLLNNGHALHENEEEYASKLVNDTTPFGTAETTLRTMMSSAGQRIIPLDNQYGDTFTQGGGPRVHYPNMIEPQTVDAIRKMNDPGTMQQVARMESGGSNYGGKTGISSPGTQVGLLLTKKAPSQGAPVTPDILQEYLRVYGATDPGGGSSLGTIKKALAANGWAVK